jgi:hypothetical protein
MATRKRDEDKRGRSQAFCRPSFKRSLFARRVLPLELPEFLIYALEQRVAEANMGTSDEDTSTLNHYIESELVNLITLRDVAELEVGAPGFGAAVQQWLDEIEP